jgi:hypothetical protein
MTLENLLKIGQLKEHKTSATEIERLLHSAEQSLADAAHEEIGAETRFDAAYKAIMQCSLVAMMAHGYRPDTKKPGHHATMIQSLPKTLGVVGTRVAVLDTLRHKRNLSDYTGADVDDESVRACIQEAKQLRDEVRAWLRHNRPALLK